ncbi:MAG: chitobiase/beta-hexosaminidase C-terminal domain-containing protein, partial [Treponema sp.]|nr:chitobiase/beta-hexosaminidase C-terminal domain-containing protein [Treponema sp.]
FNTAELTFMRGLDNSTYYSLTADKKGYWETTGCGNNLQCDNAIVRNFILDSLTYWIDEMGVDGYRFDLAPVLGREKSGSEWVFRQNAKTINDIVALGNSKNAEMIAEAWDTQWPGGYQVGNFPKGWGEWNGRFRDAIRGFVNTGNRGSVNDYINGDYNNFNDQGGPHKSVNFVVAHDGFTLADLCSYQGNGNAQNGILEWPFGPSDGGNGDYNTLGFGTEQINKRQAARNYIAIQMMSRGVPMIVWGDEFCRTQNGNNNPYNIDSVATWSNYNMINTASPHKVVTGGAGSYHNNFGTFENAESINGNFVFMNYMLKLKAKEPALNQKDYKVPYNFKKEDGTSTLNDGDNCVWIHIDGDKVSGGSDYLVFMNMYTTEVKFTLPKAASGKSWVRIVDTQSYFETELNCWNDETADSVEISGKYGVAPWSVVILKEVAKRETVSNPKIVASGANANGAFAGSTTVTITCDTTAASIYYTTDGSEPSAENGTLYNGAIDVTNSVTIKAIALKDGCVPSAVVTKKLTNTSSVEPPVLSVPAGDFWNTITVFVTGATSDATYYYTTDGTEPDTSSSKYAASTGIKIDATTTLKVVGTKSGLANSSVVSAEYTKQAAQNYTENKSGVILQGFNWDSAPRGADFSAESPNPKWYKWYKTMKTYSDEIKNRFEYVWFPPASKTDTSSSEGYAPNELNNLNSCYGTEEELKAVVESIKPAKAIADIVVNHRSGTTSWGDFTNPKWNDDYYSICSDDEGFSSSGSPMFGSSKKGAADSGMAYAAYRDLDHTNVAVQQGIYSWMNSVLKRAGFVGWRYDYVKGFDGKYVGYYNAMTDAAFSVGEYWPDSGTWKTLINNWISATENSVNGQAGKKSRAFDFVLKQNLNNAFGWTKVADGVQDKSQDELWDLSLLADSSTLMRSNPSAAITFVDNHDTGSTQQHWELSWFDVPVAYAYILTHPGMPCVASQHYFAEDGWQYRGAETVPGTTKTMKEHIDYLIQLRQDLGIEYDDTVTVLASSKTSYVAKIAGTSGEIIIKIGGDAYTPTGTGYTGNYPIYSGTNFAIWQKGNAGVEPVKIKVVLSATKDVGSGNAVYFTGAFDEAENWKKAVRGEWSDGNVWKATVTITEGQSFDWKALKGAWSDKTVVTLTGDGWEWQPNPNNTYPSKTSTTF